MSKKEIQLPATPIPTSREWGSRAVIFEFTGPFDEVNELLAKAKTAGVPAESYPESEANKKRLFKLTATFERTQFIEFVNLLTRKKT